MQSHELKLITFQIERPTIHLLSELKSCIDFFVLAVWGKSKVEKKLTVMFAFAVIRSAVGKKQMWILPSFFNETHNYYELLWWAFGNGSETEFVHLFDSHKYKIILCKWSCNFSDKLWTASVVDGNHVSLDSWSHPSCSILRGHRIISGCRRHFF